MSEEKKYSITLKENGCQESVRFSDGEQQIGGHS